MICPTNAEGINSNPSDHAVVLSGYIINSCQQSQTGGFTRSEHLSVSLLTDTEADEIVRDFQTGMQCRPKPISILHSSKVLSKADLLIFRVL